ncbi:hypothetical protein [Acidovorax sp. SDU_ACID1]|uniref:hypothetical protein n=1 Tax=Acidovorax sp. SDU_ACID1 TaxID=3136632 RepID=UPI0038733B6F
MQHTSGSPRRACWTKAVAGAGIVLGHSLAGAQFSEFSDAQAQPPSPSQGPGLEAAVQEIGTAVQRAFGALGRLLGGQDAALAALVKEGKWEEAQQMYLSGQADYDQSEEARASVLRIAQHLHAASASADEALLADLNAVPARAADAARWPAISDALKTASERVREVEAHPVLGQPPYQPPGLGALRQAKQAAEVALQAARPAQFAAYDHAAAVPFFDAYPLATDAGERQRLLVEQFGALRQQVESAPLERAGRLLKALGPQVADGGQRDLLARAWQAAYVREHGGGPLRLRQRMEMAAALDAWLPGHGLRPRWAVAAWQGSGSSRLQVLKGTLDAQVLEAAPGASVAQWAERARGQGFDVLVLERAAPVVHHAAPTGYGAQPGRYVERHDSRPNPEVAQLRAQLASAESDLRQAQQAQRDAEAQIRQMSRSATSGGMAALALLGAGGVAFGTAAAESRVSELRSALARTPATVTEPVYRDYQRRTMVESLVVVAPLALYTVDVQGGQAARLVALDAQTGDREAVVEWAPKDDSVRPPGPQDRTGWIDARVAAATALPAAVTRQSLADGLDKAPIALDGLDAAMQEDERAARAFAEQQVAALQQRAASAQASAPAANAPRPWEAGAGAARQDQARGGSAAVSCTDAGLMARFGPEIERIGASASGMGICQASRAAADLFGRIAQTLARECTNEPGIAEFRQSMEQSRKEALETAAGSCG